MTEEKQQIIWHQHSNHLLRWIVDNIKPSTLADLGSGHNFYVNALRHFDFISWGYDSVDMFSDFQIVADITKPLKLDVDYTLCIEVGEHIPEQYESIVFDNICQAKKYAIVSWAGIGQEGIGHINCKSLDDVVEQMHERDFMYHQGMTESLREANQLSHCDWITRNIAVYENMSDIH